MKKTILAVLTVSFLFSGCNTLKKVFKSTKSEKTTKESTERNRDSVYTASETLPSSNVIVLTEEDFKLRGDFEQHVSSGGNKTTIRKQNGKVTIKNENAGSVNTSSNTKESEVKQSSYVEVFISEYKKIVHRMPIRYWIYLFIAILIWQRKLLSQILVAFYPSLGTKRLFKLFLGQKID